MFAFSFAFNIVISSWINFRAGFMGGSDEGIRPKALHRTEMEPTDFIETFCLYSAHILPFYYFKNFFNNMLLSTPRLYNWSFHFRFSYQNFHALIFSSIFNARPTNLMLGKGKIVPVLN